MKKLFLSALENLNIPDEIAALPKLAMTYDGDYPVQKAGQPVDASLITPNQIALFCQQFPRTTPICIDVEESGNFNRMNSRIAAVKALGLSRPVSGYGLFPRKNYPGIDKLWNKHGIDFAKDLGCANVADRTTTDFYFFKGFDLVAWKASVDANIPLLRSWGKPLWCFVSGNYADFSGGGGSLPEGLFDAACRYLAAKLSIAGGDRIVVWDARSEPDAAGIWHLMDFSRIDGPWSTELKALVAQ